MLLFLFACIQPEPADKVDSNEPVDTGCPDDAVDADMDGVAMVCGDCDDTNSRISPGIDPRTETVGDLNCDHHIGTDEDGDGYYPNDNDERADCRDTDPAFHPGADDSTCDGEDQDCDGVDCQ